MNTAAVLVAVLALCAGGALGWLAARQRGAAELRSVESDSASLRAALAAERSAALERDALLERTDARVREAFGSLAGEALSRNNEAFVALAEARLATARTAADGELAQRQQAIDGIVAPLRESLERVQHQLAAVEKDRAGSYSALLEQVATMRQTSEQLRTETAQLVTALRAPQVRGRWGELQLERALEAAGMTEHVDYVTQVSAPGPDGPVRPDLIVRLVGGKNVVVDAKVAFSGYLEAMEARDEATRNARLKAHARHLREHIDALAAKAYWQRFTPTPEFVVCFVPADAFLDAALREDPSLMERAFERDVVLATPSTLVALLRTIAYTWRQEALTANAQQVHLLGRELYQRLSTMGRHVDKLGRAITTTVTSYNQAVATLEGRVLVTARRMSDLKVVAPAEELIAPIQVTEAARATQAPELMDQRVVALAKPRISPGQTDLLNELRDASGEA